MSRRPYTVIDLTPESMCSKIRGQGAMGLLVARYYVESSDDVRATIAGLFADPEAFAGDQGEVEASLLAIRIVESVSVACPIIACSPIGERCRRNGKPVVSPCRARTTKATARKTQ